MAKELFSPQQLKELQEISKLPGEEQQKKFNEFLKKCTPEQVESLKKQYSGGECPFCLIKDGKLKSNILYKDDRVMVVFDINPASKGHMLIVPLQHESSIIKSKDYDKIMKVVQKCGQIVFDILKVEGVNILIGDGATAGQKVAHGYVHVIPRIEGDKVNFSWDKAEVDMKEYDKLTKEISNRLKEVKLLEVKPVKIVTKIKDYEYSERVP